MAVDEGPSVLPDVLTVLTELIHEHRNRASGGHESCVVPLLVTGYARWTPIFAEVVRAEGGAIIDAAQYIDGCISGLPDASQLTHLVAALRTVEEGLPDLHLEVQGGDVRVAGAGTGIDSDGVEVLRGIIAALFHPDLRELSLLVLVFEERALDEEIATPLWTVLMNLAALLELPPGRTVVLVAGDARLAIGRHCSSDPSVRFSIGETAVMRRQPWASSLHAVNEVARLTPDDAPLLFLLTGAGATKYFGLPTGNELRDRALVAWLGEDASALDFDERARRFFRELATAEGDRLRPEERAEGIDAFVASLTLERVLREEQYRENQRDSRTIRGFRVEHEHVLSEIEHRHTAGIPLSPLGALVEHGRQMVVLTVNFDQTLETECPDGVRPFVTEADFASLPGYVEDYIRNGGQVPYIKLHGDIAAPDTIVANVEETEAGLSRARLGALRLIRNLDLPVRPWIYIGYSMRDLDINGVLAAPDSADGVVEWWVGPFIDPSVERFLLDHRVPRWTSHMAGYSVRNRCVTLTATEYLQRLVEALPSP